MLRNGKLGQRLSSKSCFGTELRFWALPCPWASLGPPASGFILSPSQTALTCHFRSSCSHSPPLLPDPVYSCLLQHHVPSIIPTLSRSQSLLFLSHFCVFSLYIVISHSLSIWLKQSWFYSVILVLPTTAVSFSPPPPYSLRAGLLQSLCNTPSCTGSYLLKIICTWVSLRFPSPA